MTVPDKKWWQHDAGLSAGELLLRIAKEVSEIRHEVEEIEHFLFGSKKAVSAALFFQNSKGERFMDVTVHLNDAPLAAVQVEFDGPGGTGNIVPNVGPTSYTSSDPTVATVDPVTGFLKYLKAGVTTVTGLNAGNRLTSTGVLTVISGLAQSAVLQFVAQVPGPIAKTPKP